MTNPFIVVGLGNPGKEYERTYHNLGFEVVDRLGQLLSVNEGKSRFRSQIYESDFRGRKILLLKPQTYMNLSGEAVAECARFFKADPKSDLLIVSDDLDLPTAQLRMRLTGGAGGHNGLKSVISCLGTEAFPRIRVGVGRHPTIPSDKYVLMKILAGHKSALSDSIERAAQSIQIALNDGLPKAMDYCNQKLETQESDEKK